MLCFAHFLTICYFMSLTVCTIHSYWSDDAQATINHFSILISSYLTISISNYTHIGIALLLLITPVPDLDVSIPVMQLFMHCVLFVSYSFTVMLDPLVFYIQIICFFYSTILVYIITHNTVCFPLLIVVLIF